jgi:solute carrier family 12 (potassium/chloride transporters), member 9
MFFVDGLSASGSVCILLVLIIMIHYTTPPKPWGSISEVLIYHQVRKYLLRLKTEHVKFWRPQILLLVNDPRRSYKLITFCNSLKKGALFIIGHVIVTQNFGDSVPEARRQQAAWNKFIDLYKIKAFVNVAISPSIEWGARNIFLSAGLGGMRPNIVVFGFYNLQQFRSEQPLVDVPSPPPERKAGSIRRRRTSRSQIRGNLPTDDCYVEQRTDIQSYVMVLEDMLLKLRTNVAVAVGFSDLELPKSTDAKKKYIDLWPIQMSANIGTEDQGEEKNVTTTNFDTYTLILQLGCILNTVPSWKRTYAVRVGVFVEYETDVGEEKARVTSLLENLRIKAEVMVFWLASGSLNSYNFVVNGQDVDDDAKEQVNKVLEDEAWWQDLQRLRGNPASGEISAVDALSIADDIAWPASSLPRRDGAIIRFEGLRKILAGPRKRSSFGNLSSLGVSLSMRTSRIDDDMLSRHASHPSDSERSDSEDELDTDEEEVSDEDHTEEEDSHMHQSTESLGRSGKSKSSSKKSHSKNSSKKSSRASSRLSNHGAKHQDEDLEMGFNDDLLDSDESNERHRGRRSEGQGSDDASPRQGLTVPRDRPRSISPSFTSSPVPPAKVAEDEGPGPSIMFADEPHPRRRQESDHAATEARQTTSIYQRTRDDSTGPQSFASGFPASGSIPISFNDLPSRAQHLILNELISQNSDDTAVIFTTLPAPSEGTFKDEGDSLSYVSDLEVLAGGLPPTLLVHSNSMTVTTNL